MSRIRIYELARELDIPSRKLVEALADLNLNVQNHMSTIDESIADIIRDVIRPKADKKEVEATRPDDKLSESAKPVAPDPPPTQDDQQVKQGKQGGTTPARPVSKKESDAKQMTVKEEVSKKNTALEQEDLEQGLEEEEYVAPRSKAERSRARRRAGERSGGSRTRSTSKRRSRRQMAQEQMLAASGPKQVAIPREDIAVSELAKLLKFPATEVIRKLISLGVMAAINQTVDSDTAILVATELGYEAELAAPPEPEYDSPFDMPVEPDAPEDLKPRPPIVTVMGHVDHGKTSLLDAIRHTKVTAGEAGGITQHIGAYQVRVMGEPITFLDTPGHEAFTAMRARGAQATDIAVLVVAADDGVMPQTVEAINHAKAAGVPIIVAVNKIDRPQANPDRVKQQLTEHGLVPEEWGGDTICVNVSALQRQGIEDLLTAILTLAEILELKANPNKPARGLVIESKIDKGRGPVATVLVNEGTLRVGDAILAGMSYGRIRAMLDDNGRRIKSAGPSAPVEIVGLSDVAEAGEPFMIFDDEKTARNYGEQMREKKRQEELQAKQRGVSLDDLFQQIQQGQVKELRIIIKADVQGSIEALRQSLVKLSNPEVEVKVIHEGVGPVNESDILLANASEAVIVGFNVRPDANVRRLAEEQNVDIRLYRVIYDAIEDVEKAIKGLLAPVYKEVVLGQAEVRQVFKVSRVGTVAGSYVTDGKITRNAQARLIRGGIVVHESRIESLKRFKDDVREVVAGYECGIGLEGYNDIKEGDIIETFTMEEVPK
ncbi:MAG: translation initiation factor IF-2 [Firmicutes bacterium]|nr:translation initiation factor IF-2 [Bacillota bacterium]